MMAVLRNRESVVETGVAWTKQKGGLNRRFFLGRLLGGVGYKGGIVIQEPGVERQMVIFENVFFKRHWIFTLLHDVAKRRF